MTRLVRLMEPGRVVAFVVDDELREINEPDGLASWRQLYRLNAAGLLALVEPGQVEPLTKGQCSHAISDISERQPEDAMPTTEVAP